VNSLNFFSYCRLDESVVFGDIHASPVSMSSGVISRVSLKAVMLLGFMLLSVSFWKKKFAWG